jgi:hypothetical protein
MSLKLQDEYAHLAKYEVYKAGEEPPWLLKINIEDEINTIKKRVARGVTDEERPAILARLKALHEQLSQLERA